MKIKFNSMMMSSVQLIRLNFSCPKLSDRLLYQSEAEQLVLERGLVAAEPEVSGIQGTTSLSYKK